MTRADVGHPMTNPVTLTEGMRETALRALLSVDADDSEEVERDANDPVVRMRELQYIDAVLASLGLGEDGENVVVPKGTIMTPAPDEETRKQMTAAMANYRKYINDTPALMSLLYDIDLLPEQIVLPVNVTRMIAVCELLKRVPDDSLRAMEARPDA